MTTTTFSTGTSTGDRPINLHQLNDELGVAGVQVEALGMSDGYVYTYDDQGQPADFPVEQQPIVDQVIGNHVAMRDKTDAELAAEFRNPATTSARKQDIRDQQSGLALREQVPMT